MPHPQPRAWPGPAGRSGAGGPQVPAAWRRGWAAAARVALRHLPGAAGRGHRCPAAAGGLRPRCSHGAQVSEGGSARPGSFRDCAGRPGRRGGSKGTPYPGRTAAISGRVGGRRRRRELRALWGGSLAGVCVQTDCSFSPRFSNFSFSAGCSGLKGSLSRVSSLWHLSDVRAEVPLAGFLAVAFVASVNKLPGYCVEFRLPLIIVKPRRDLFEVEGHHPAGFATRLIKNAHVY